MNKSKKFKIVIALAVLSLLLSPVMALAIDESTPPSGGISIGELIANIKYAVWLVFGIVALIMFVIAGILFLTAGGAPEKVQAARSAAIWGVVGVVVGIVAYSIITIVSTLMGAS